MRIPKKITPDRIKAVVLEIRFTSEYPFEILLGLIFKSLDDSYKYTARDKDRHIFFNEVIRFSIVPKAIQFTYISDNYIGWEKFLPEVKKAYEQIVNSKSLKSVERLGLRITSAYPNMDLKDFVNFSFSYGHPEVVSNNYFFRTEFNNNDCVVILQLAKGMARIENEDVLISQIDIDSLIDNISIDANNINHIVENIEKIHETEKNVFFTLLKQEFIQTLNPIY